MRRFEERRKDQLEETKEEPVPGEEEIKIADSQAIFHGTVNRDYQGKSYLDPPSYLKN